MYVNKIDKIIVKETKLLNPTNWNQMNVILITQARVGSTRLPNKVLKKILSHQDFLDAKFDISWYDRLNS